MPINFETFSLFSTGYIVGLSSSTGFFAFVIQKYFVQNGGFSKKVLWTTSVCVNILMCTLNPIILIALFVVGNDGMQRSDFWQRMVLFLAGIIVGLVVVVVSVLAINRVISRSAIEITGT
jgi:cell shape-determining protein MreD